MSLDKILYKTVSKGGRDITAGLHLGRTGSAVKEVRIAFN